MKKTKDGEKTSTRTRFSSFSAINEKEVDDITIEFFYKPHTVTLLLISIGVVIYSAFVRYVFEISVYKFSTPFYFTTYRVIYN